MLWFPPCHFSLALASFLVTVHLPRVTSSIFTALVSFVVPILTLSKTPFSFACSFVDSLQREIHDSLVPFFSQAFNITFRRHSIRALVSILLCLCRDCCNLVDHCSPKQRHRRSTESEVQLHCEHIFLISDCAESVLECVRLIDERLQYVVELLHVFGSVSFRDVPDQCCNCWIFVRHVPLFVLLTIARHASNPVCHFVCCTMFSGLFAVGLCKTW